MSNQRRNNKPKVPNSVKYFANITFRKFKKDAMKDDYYDYYGKSERKKAIRRDYFDSLLTELPDVIEWLLYNSNKTQDDIHNIVVGCYRKFTGAGSDKEFKDDDQILIRKITKIIEKYGRKEIPNIEYLPIILATFITDIINYNNNLQEGEQPLASPDALYDLSTLILKKRLKKAKKKGIPYEISFDLLSVLPEPGAMKYSPYYRARLLFDILYAHAEKEGVPFGLIIEFLVDRKDYGYIIGYALQERKDKYRGFNETQKKLFNDITTWVFVELEEMDRAEIRKILRNYINVRKRDASAGKDSNRRYYITSLPAESYPTISEVVESLLKENVENKKFL